MPAVLISLFFLDAKEGVFKRDPHHDHFDEALAQIPAEAGVAAIIRFGLHLAN